MAMRRAQADDAADRGERKTPVPARQYQPVPLRAIAPVMRSAALIGEDHRFYEHAGIDYVEFRHALGYRPDEIGRASGRGAVGGRGGQALRAAEGEVEERM